LSSNGLRRGSSAGSLSFQSKPEPIQVPKAAGTVKASTSVLHPVNKFAQGFRAHSRTNGQGFRDQILSLSKFWASKIWIHVFHAWFEQRAT
jgi:hypothetical protein